jgi:hypothetical protein
LLALGAFIGSWLLCFCYRVQEAAAKDFSFLGHPMMACKYKNKKHDKVLSVWRPINFKPMMPMGW